ncbi:hypothetical protein MTO96_006942 [Rhipicephalus appendiculatus]
MMRSHSADASCSQGLTSTFLSFPPPTASEPEGAARGDRRPGGGQLQGPPETAGEDATRPARRPLRSAARALRSISGCCFGCVRCFGRAASKPTLRDTRSGATNRIARSQKRLPSAHCAVAIESHVRQSGGASDAPVVSAALGLDHR